VAKAGIAGIAKWLGVGLVSGVVVASGAHVVVGVALRGTSAPAPVIAAAASAHVRVPAHRAPGPQGMHPVPEPPSTNEEPGATRVTSLEQLPMDAPEKAQVALRPSAVRHAPPVASSSASPSSPVVDVAEAPRTPSLSAELAVLEAARRELVAHHPDEVLRDLDAYDARTPNTGVLDSEAQMLRIEALLQQGSLARARKLAARALAANPSGAHAARLREIVALDE
jgi:hypothetical protein